MIKQSDPAVMRQQLLELGEEWADLDAAASLLEETRKSILANLMRQSGEAAHNKAETFALAHPDYGDHLADMVEKRRLATRARVGYDAARVEADMMRSAEATRRAEITMR